MTSSTFVTPPLAASPLLHAIDAATRGPEPAVVAALLDGARLLPAQSATARELALRLTTALRARARESGRAGLVQGLLQEFALSSQEGVALMCLAEALLRIPDAATRDALIRDKIAHGDWQAHLGRSPSMFVNAASWGLLLTGKLVATHSERGLGAALGRIVARGGEPLIRKGVDLSMRLMGEQFVTGETIAEALANARPREAQGFRYSYDMLGEAAMTAADAEAYTDAYARAIEAIGIASEGRGIVDGPGISIKLSALHPRYVRGQIERVRSELYPRLLGLAELACRHDIGLNIDAEEADRLELSLELLERLCHEPALAGWNGIGFVVQAYQKRCPRVIDYLVDLARRSGHRLMVRLVKGAYWDSEIKRAQLDGLEGYPVYTRKVHTDVAYVACARALLAAPDAVYPQFATHNAQTLAAIHTLADPATWRPGQYEFQCLHGMGEPLYEQVVGEVGDGKLGRPCRVYAPVGTHETLLAYLVRRLLENGANTSFVNRIADPDVDLAALVRDPVEVVEETGAREGRVGLPHPHIPQPLALYGARRNSQGLDLANERVLAGLPELLAAEAQHVAEPLLAVDAPRGPALAVRNPADRGDVVGHVHEADATTVDLALQAALKAKDAWAHTPPAERAACLERAADAFEAARDRLLPLIVREAGKTWANAVAELREAVDFLRYDAAEVRAGFDNATHVPLGAVACISPWNFPLAIFTGQVAAALAAGNVVLAKPAEQTPLVAAEAVRLFRQAGVPHGALQLLPGHGEVVGAALVADPRVQGVVFTGSTEVARILQRTLAARLGEHGDAVPLIAETGGQNAMIVDSSALAEQVVTDVLASAFDSAGQRCSALRVLCVQEDCADRVLGMLEHAVQELVVGDTRRLDVDVGPVIDDEARAGIVRHVDAMRASGHRVVQPSRVGDEPARRGSFVAPTLIDIARVGELEREVFGPVLHLVRYRRDALPALLEQIAATGYGLTFGVHTRIDETVARVVQSAHAGNLYVNRNVVGAVVGVQPFGGEGLSGTGPKAGGPIYLLRLLSRRPATAARDAVARASTDPPKAPLRAVDDADAEAMRHRLALQAMDDWAQGQGDRPALVAAIARYRDEVPQAGWQALRGPTGQADLYAVSPREAVLCVAGDESDLLTQTAAVLAVGARAIWPARPPATGRSTALDLDALRQRLPEATRERIVIARDAQGQGVTFDVVLHQGSVDDSLALQQWLAARPGPIVGLVVRAPGRAPGDAAWPLERLLLERSLSINTAAAGGNASLMTTG